MERSRKIFIKIKPDRTAIDRKSKETTSPKAPAPPLPYLNIYETLINPLNPKKSTIEITISNTMTIGWTIRYIFRFYYFLHTPVNPKYIFNYLCKKDKA